MFSLATQGDAIRARRNDRGWNGYLERTIARERMAEARRVLASHCLYGPQNEQQV